MKRALVLLCVMGLALGASAGLTADPHRGFYIVGVEIVPHSMPGAFSAIGRPYLMLGYDAGWLVSGIGSNTPLTLGAGGQGDPSEGWFMAYAGPAFQISPIFRGFGGLAFWLRMVNFTAVAGRWSAWGGLNWAVAQGNLGDWGVQTSVFMKAHLPLQITAGAPWLGVWFTVGANVGISPPLGP